MGKPRHGLKVQISEQQYPLAVIQNRVSKRRFDVVGIICLPGIAPRIRQPVRPARRFFPLRFGGPVACRPSGNRRRRRTNPPRSRVDQDRSGGCRASMSGCDPYRVACRDAKNRLHRGRLRPGRRRIAVCDLELVDVVGGQGKWSVAASRPQRSPRIVRSILPRPPWSCRAESVPPGTYTMWALSAL